MSRIRQAIESNRDRGEKAMGLFVTNGFPTPEDTHHILKVITENGADFIELGMPFSDPLAEGIPIQRSSERALRHGVTLDHAFREVEKLRKISDIPVLLMGYINPIFKYGVSNFCRAAHSSGVDGLILPDLPPEESRLLQEEAEKCGLKMVFLIAPNSSDERIMAIDKQTDAFVYAVTVTGLTGSGIRSMESVEMYLKRARKLVRHNPLLAGFGIKSFEDASRLCRYTDGFIVGSALITLIEELWDNPDYPMKKRIETIGRFVHALKYGTSR